MLLRLAGIRRNAAAAALQGSVWSLCSVVTLKQACQKDNELFDLGRVGQATFLLLWKRFVVLPRAFCLLIKGDLKKKRKLQQSTQRLLSLLELLEMWVPMEIDSLERFLGASVWHCFKLWLYFKATALFVWSVTFAMFSYLHTYIHTHFLHLILFLEKLKSVLGILWQKTEE